MSLLVATGGNTVRNLVQLVAGLVGFAVGALVVWAGISILIELIDLTRADQDFPRGILILIIPAALFGPALGLVGGVQLAAKHLGTDDLPN